MSTQGWWRPTPKDVKRATDLRKGKDHVNTEEPGKKSTRTNVATDKVLLNSIKVVHAVSGKVTELTDAEVVRSHPGQHDLSQTMESSNPDNKKPMPKSSWQNQDTQRLISGLKNAAQVTADVTPIPTPSNKGCQPQLITILPGIGIGQISEEKVETKEIAILVQPDSNSYSIVAQQVDDVQIDNGMATQKTDANEVKVGFGREKKNVKSPEGNSSSQIQRKDNQLKHVTEQIRTLSTNNNEIQKVKLADDRVDKTSLEQKTRELPQKVSADLKKPGQGELVTECVPKKNNKHRFKKTRNGAALNTTKKNFSNTEGFSFPASPRSRGGKIVGPSMQLQMQPFQDQQNQGHRLTRNAQRNPSARAPSAQRSPKTRQMGGFRGKRSIGGRHFASRDEFIASNYKTELCRSFLATGTCVYEGSCQFAHGTTELRSRNFGVKYKTEKCQNYHQEGYCRFGTRCKFIHDEQRMQVNPKEFWLWSPSENLVRVEIVESPARLAQLKTLAPEGKDALRGTSVDTTIMRRGIQGPSDGISYVTNGSGNRGRGRGRGLGCCPGRGRGRSGHSGHTPPGHNGHNPGFIGHKGRKTPGPQPNRPLKHSHSFGMSPPVASHTQTIPLSHGGPAGSFPGVSSLRFPGSPMPPGTPNHANRPPPPPPQAAVGHSSMAPQNMPSMPNPYFPMVHQATPYYDGTMLYGPGYFPMHPGVMGMYKRNVSPPNPPSSQRC